MDIRPFNVLSLFAGICGLDVGLHAAVPELRTVCYVERESYAAATLVARMEEASLDTAPVWDDVATFDGKSWRGIVDCITGGFPCQDLSVAGKRAGLDGERSGLWSHMARICGEVQPRLVFIENVPGLRSNHAMRRILGDLSEMGFDAQWGSVRASDVGAPHRRERVFVLAYCHRHGREGERRGRLLDEQRTAQRNDTDGCDLTMADADSDGRRQGTEVQRSCQSEPQPLRTIFPPGPGDAHGWLDVIEREPWLAPALDKETAEPVVRGLADGATPVVGDSRNDALRTAGNGVVPLQAAVAFAVLAGRIGT